jgi:hypothetical protein
VTLQDEAMYRFCFCFDKFWQRPVPPFDTINLLIEKNWWEWKNLEKTKEGHEDRLRVRKEQKNKNKA